MTPGINAAKKAKVDYVVHEYSHDPNSDSYGLEAAEKMDVAPERVFKTLVVSLDGGGPDSKQLAVGIVPVNTTLSLKAIAKAAGVKKAVMADKGLVERTTGYVLGGVSPLGQKKRLRTFIDASARGFSTMFVSAGRRGLEIELSPDDLARLSGAVFAGIAQIGD